MIGAPSEVVVIVTWLDTLVPIPPQCAFDLERDVDRTAAIDRERRQCKGELSGYRLEPGASRQLLLYSRLAGKRHRPASPLKASF